LTINSNGKTLIKGQQLTTKTTAETANKAVPDKDKSTHFANGSSERRVRAGQILEPNAEWVNFFCILEKSYFCDFCPLQSEPNMLK